MNWKLHNIHKSQISQLALCAGVAFFVTLVLFYFMSLLISGTADLTKKADTSGVIEFIRTKPRSFLDEKKRKLPQKKPKQVKPPQIKPLSSMLSKPKKNLVKMDRPDLKTALKGSGPAMGGVGMSNSGGTPLVRIEPQYPRKAAMRGIEGWVILQFSISSTGSVTDVKILNSHPRGMFDKVAIRALLKWKYRPLIEDGKPVKQENQTVQLDFKLEK